MLRILSVLTVAGLAALCSADPQVALAGAMPAKTTCVVIKVSNGAQNGEIGRSTLLTLVVLPPPIPLTLRLTRSCPIASTLPYYMQTTVLATIITFIARTPLTDLVHETPPFIPSSLTPPPLPILLLYHVLLYRLLLYRLLL